MEGKSILLRPNVLEVVCTCWSRVMLASSLVLSRGSSLITDQYKSRASRSAC